MKRWLIVVALGLSIQAPIHADEVLRVYNWDAYMDPGVIQDFERSQHIKVDYRTFADANALKNALQRGESFDLVFPTDHQLQDLIKAGLIVELDSSRLKNRESLDPYLLKLIVAKGAERYAAPYMWGTVGLVVNERIAKHYYGGQLPNSWGVLFERQSTDKLAGCGVVMLNAAQEAVSLKMTYKGKRLGDSGERSIRKEVSSLLNPGFRLSPADYSSYVSQMLNGKICAAMSWDVQLHGEGEKHGLRFSVPDEGSLIFIDSMAIPKSAQHPQLAHAFIDFLLDPANVARNATFTHATPAIREALLAGKGVPARRNISRDERARLYLLDPLNENQSRALDATWPPRGVEAH
ncbi:extracellular solute-binding protein [Pseudomonas nitroreducens]|uniref:Extracellular solute-binding protein n=1 Tax=Pseudomonas nitroreducens TaxID=46680 RepID=A0A6G6J7G3_PSENT|nr:extracellular solute-binding protein [Pseudomonas nitroreducens]QIE91212.1 extracellular solute-binding protein [Pseudomonas nitroreducens]